MPLNFRKLALSAICSTVATVALAADVTPERGPQDQLVLNPAVLRAFDAAQARNAAELLMQGREIFRNDTFGSEDFGVDRSSCTKPSRA
jgi:hypothetical protein